MRKWIGAAALALATAATIGTPALADTKAGVDAWNRGDYVGAVAEWRRAAIAGDPDAQFNLGQAYKLGRGVPVDLAMAESWYRKAAAQGHPQAIDNYGLALFQDGKRQDAVPWLEKSVARGEPRAQLVLGTMLFNGDGVQRDWVRAYALMVRSSAAGLPQGSQTLAEMDKYIPEDQRRQGLELARTFEEQAARPGFTGEVAGGGSGRPTNYGPVSGGGRPRGGPAITTIDVPPSPDGPVDGRDSMSGSTTYPTGKPPRTKPPVVAQVPSPKPRPAPVPASGGWRLQLGAFGDPANARKLWSQVGSRFPGRQVSYVKAGSLTKVLVGPYPSKSDAAGACGSVRPCVAVGP